MSEYNRYPVATDVTGLIGETPLLKLKRIPDKNSAQILCKLEFYNPGGSVKDRIALAMIADAEKKGLLKPGGTLVEPTSGNTGIGLAMVCAQRGYKLILVMPEDMSQERRVLLKAYGADLVLTPAQGFMTEAVRKAKEIKEQNPDYFMPEQFANRANPESHKCTTAPEIDKDTEGKFDAFVAGIGTGGTITGVGEYFKAKNSNVKIIGVEPAASSVISGGKPGIHRIQGIGAGFIPAVLNRSVIDEMVTVTDHEAYLMTKRLAREEGLLLGISSGANVAAALKVGAKLGPYARVVTICCDMGERYFSLEAEFESELASSNL
ncbi:MAG TPA: cysteine synthase A [bacterium]|nr:cysteine synthase A [bacterium]